MSESEIEPEAEAEDAPEDADGSDGATAETEARTGEQAAKRTGQLRSCQRCGREQALVGKYDIWLCRQCFREVARKMGFKKYS